MKRFEDSILQGLPIGWFGCLNIDGGVTIVAPKGKRLVYENQCKGRQLWITAEGQKTRGAK